MSAHSFSPLGRIRRLFGRTGGAVSASHIDAHSGPATGDNAVDRVPATGDNAVAAQVAAIESRLNEMAQRIEQLQNSMAEVAVQAAPLQETLAALDRHIGRAGREQFKANALAEAQLERLTAAFEALRVAEARRDAAAAALNEQSRASETAARLEVVQAILPALDGLDEALRAGRGVLDRPVSTPPVPPPALLDRLFGRPEPPSGVTAEIVTLREDMGAWLDGVAFVRGRLLDALAAQEVVPIAAEGKPFDPHRHIALEVVPAGPTLPPGTVAAELRRGYLAGDRVLRHAEVAVARQGDRIGAIA